MSSQQQSQQYFEEDGGLEDLEDKPQDSQLQQPTVQEKEVEDTMRQPTRIEDVDELLTLQSFLLELRSKIDMESTVHSNSSAFLLSSCVTHIGGCGEYYGRIVY